MLFLFASRKRGDSKLIDGLTAVNIGKRYYQLMIKDRDYESYRVSLFRKYEGPSSLSVTLDKKEKEVESLMKLETQMFYCHAEDDEYRRLFSYLIVVLNSLKHSLDYRAAKKDFKIGDLKNKYRSMYEKFLSHDPEREYEK